MRNAECQGEGRSASDLSRQFHTPHSAFRIPGGAVTAWDSQSVAAALGVSAPARLRFSGVTTDTRSLRAGSLFLPLQGERFDAPDFLADARTKGAAAAVVRHGTPRVDGLPVLQVVDALAAPWRLPRWPLARRRRA